MSNLKTFTIENIRSWDPCYDPSRHLAEGWSGTAVDILKRDDIPLQDRFWVVLREEVIDEKTLRTFAIWCARQVQHLMADAKSTAVLDVAERYIAGDASESELEVAQAAARAAARDAAWVAARDAAGETALAAALAAAWAAAWVAAGAAAGAAARDAAGQTALAAAGAAARDTQLKHLIKLLTEKHKENENDKD